MPEAFTFVHTADLHLDAPFKGVDATDARVRDALVESTYDAFGRVVDVCVQRRVDFLVIAGDVFNSRDKTLRAQLRFRAATERLAEASIPVYIAQGNHDPASGWSAGLDMPHNVHYFAIDRVERVEIPDPEAKAAAPLCVLYGQGYATEAVTTNLAADFRREPGDVTAIGVLHANVGGQPGYESYAPCTLDDLRAAGMDYWALGHIHKPMKLSDSPRIRYCGSPQGLNPKEDGPHGCRVVTMKDGMIAADEFVETSSVRWARVELDISECESLEAVSGALRVACAREREQAGGAPVIVRVDLVGRTPAHADLVRGTSLGDVLEDLRDEQLSLSPWIWIDRLRDLTRSTFDIEEVRDSSDFAGDLVRIADELTADGERSAEFVAQALSGLQRIGAVEEFDPGALIERARDLCLDRLLVEDDR